MAENRPAVIPTALVRVFIICYFGGNRIGTIAQDKGN